METLEMRKTVLWVRVSLGTRALGDEAPSRAEDERERTQLATAVAVRPASPPSASLVEPAYSGTYVYAGSEAERAAVKLAVDRAIEGMFGKFIAREELMKRSAIRPSYTIRFDPPGMVSVETPGFPPESSPADGTELNFRTKYGGAVKNSEQFVADALLQRGRTADGSGSTEFRLLADGNTLPGYPGEQEPELAQARRVHADIPPATGRALTHARNNRRAGDTH
jgi:hypothetical protein